MSLDLLYRRQVASFTMCLAEDFPPTHNSTIASRKLTGYLFFVCSCTSRYVGEFCEHRSPCDTGPQPRCQNGGICKVNVSQYKSPSFTCDCPIGFTASLCEIHEENACDSNPCNNGGTCTLTSLDKYTCTCAAGYTGKYNSWVLGQEPKN